MAYLATPAATSGIIEKYGLRFQKKYGQNFLIDANILKKILVAAQVTKQDCVIEIGPGIGTMTQYLAESAREVVAVEIDKNLIPVLEETLADHGNVTVINGDILKVDISALAAERNEGMPMKVVANLPYYITTPVIMGLLENGAPVSDITVMVQKEVAQRMQAGPGTKDYGVLSLAVQYYAKVEMVGNVPPSCFMPRPKVGSCVVKLVRRKEPCVEVSNERKFFSLIHAAFGQRRKTLANALANAPAFVDDFGNPMKVEREHVYHALEEMGLIRDVRGETLTLEQFAKLCALLQ